MNVIRRISHLGKQRERNPRQHPQRTQEPRQGRQLPWILPCQIPIDSEQGSENSAQTQGERSALSLDGLHHFRVPLVAEADAGVLRPPTQAREVTIQSLFEVLAELVEGGFHAPAHLEVVLLRQVVDRMRVGSTLVSVCLECSGS